MKAAIFWFGSLIWAAPLLAQTAADPLTPLPVTPRATRIASIVASVPEFVNRHSGSPKRKASISATTALSSHGLTNSVPRAS